MLSQRLVDTLYVEAMLLADEAQGYFIINGRVERDRLPPLQRIGFSCESLRVAARLTQITAWLLARRAVATGEISEAQGAAPGRRLGLAPDHDPEILAGLPEAARQIIDASVELYERIRRLDSGMHRPSLQMPSPAHGLVRRLEAAF